MRVALAALLLCPLAARAEGPPVDLGYVAYVAGVPVMTLAAQLAISPSAYKLEIGYRTQGIVGALMHADLHSAVQGQFGAEQPMPQRFSAWGQFRGSARQTLIDYPGDIPLVRTLLPPAKEEREPVPPQDTKDTVDTLSALAMLVHRVAETGQCEGQVRVFDGRRLSEISAHTAGREVLEADRDSVFAGPALRCDFAGRMLAGFLFDEDRARQAEPQEGAAWIAAPRPGMAPVPVRINFRLRIFGHVTAYLTQVSPR